MIENIVSLSVARGVLGRGVVICLEPDAVLDAKYKAGRAVELWCFDPETGQIRRGDGKFFDVRYVDRGGWGQIALYEEPNVPQPESGSGFSELPLFRIVGHVIIERNPSGYVRTRKAKGLNGEVLELKPSSISKDELAEKGLQPVGYIESNPQRIIGMIAVYLVDADFPDAEGMTPAEFRKQSRDARSLAALAKAGL